MSDLTTTADSPAPQESANPTVALMKAKEHALARIVGAKKMARFMANTLAQLRKDTKLLRCEPASFYAAAHQAAVLGLQPGMLGEVYLVPYGKQATLILGYKGMMQLAMRHPSVVKITATCVYQGEDYSRDGATGVITHHTSFDIDKSDDKLVGAYCRVVITGTDEPITLDLNRKQIEERRSRSAAKNGNFWRNDYAAMARKTVIRAHFNGGEVPCSPEMELAIEYEQEEERKAEILSVQTEVPDGPVTEVQIGFDDREPEDVMNDEVQADVNFGLGEPEGPGTSTPPDPKKSSTEESEPANVAKTRPPKSKPKKRSAGQAQMLKEIDLEQSRLGYSDVELLRAAREIIGSEDITEVSNLTVTNLERVNEGLAAL